MAISRISSSTVYENKSITTLQASITAAIAALTTEKVIDFQINTIWRNEYPLHRVMLIKAPLEHPDTAISALTVNSAKTLAATNTAIAAWLATGFSAPATGGTPKIEPFKYRTHPNRFFYALPTLADAGESVFSDWANANDADLTLTDDMTHVYLTSHATVPVVCTLPTPVGREGKQFYIHLDDGSAGAATSLATAAGSFSIPDIGDFSTVTLSNDADANQTVGLQSDGTNWLVISNTHKVGDAVASDWTNAANAALAVTDDMGHVYVTSTGAAGTFNVTLPTAVGKEGQRHTIYLDDGSVENVVLASTAGSFSIPDIGDIPTIPLSNDADANQVITVQSDGTNWLVISNTHKVGDAVASDWANAANAALTVIDNMGHVYVTSTASAGAFNVTLPTAVGKEGQRHTVHLDDGSVNAVTLATAGGNICAADTAGAATLALSVNANANQVITLQSDGTDWIIQSNTH